MPEEEPQQGAVASLSTELLEEITRQRQQLLQLVGELVAPAARMNRQLEEIETRQRRMMAALGQSDLRDAIAEAERRILAIPERLTSSSDLHRRIQRFTQAYESHWSSIQELADRLSRELPRNVDRYGALMLKMGWPPPKDLTLPEGRQLVEAYDNGEVTEDEIEAWLVDFYDPSQLRRLQAEWENRGWLSRRLPILQSAIDAHVAGDYNLSVPTLLPQLEGALAEAFGHQGPMRGRDVERYADQLFQADSPISLWERAKDFYLQFLLVGFHWGGGIPRLSRHAILHGADTAYGTVENSLRIILLFDYLQGAIQFIGSAGGKVYHRPGCHVLKRATTDRTVFRTKSEAEVAMTRACRLCLRHETD